MIRVYLQNKQAQLDYMHPELHRTYHMNTKPKYNNSQTSR